MHKENKEQDDLWEVTVHGTDVKEKLKKNEEKGPTQQQSLLKNWPLMSSIIVYCVFQLHDMAYSEVIFHVFILGGLGNGFIIQDNVYNLLSQSHFTRLEKQLTICAWSHKNLRNGMPN